MAETITVELIKEESPDAILVEFEGEEHWLPKSKIRYSGSTGDIDVEIQVPQWLLEEKGMV